MYPLLVKDAPYSSSGTSCGPFLGGTAANQISHQWRRTYRRRLLGFPNGWGIWLPILTEILGNIDGVLDQNIHVIGCAIGSPFWDALFCFNTIRGKNTYHYTSVCKEYHPKSHSLSKFPQSVFIITHGMSMYIQWCIGKGLYAFW